MSNFLYSIAIIAIVVWCIGYLGFHMGGLFHLLIALALISLILRVIKGEKVI